MWIVLNNSFLSIVKNRNNENQLLVSARVKGDIEKVFEDADVFEDENADYKYRSYISHLVVGLIKKLAKISFSTFILSFKKVLFLNNNLCWIK